MRKVKLLFILLLIACLLSGLAACGAGNPVTADNAVKSQGSGPPDGQVPQTSEPEQDTLSAEDPPQDKADGVLVVYFSATGNTKVIAEAIASLTSGDIYEIIPAQPYTSEDLDYHNSDSRSSIEMSDPDARPEIGGTPVELEGYATVYLGYPIWHGQAPRIMSTFVESCNFDGITVVPFCTSGSSGIGASAETLEEQAGSGVWLDGERFSASVSEDNLLSWISGLSM